MNVLHFARMCVCPEASQGVSQNALGQVEQRVFAEHFSLNQHTAGGREGRVSMGYMERERDE